GEPARPVVPVEAEALRIRQRQDGAGTVRFTGYQSALISCHKAPVPPIARPAYSLWLRCSLKHFHDKAAHVPQAQIRADSEYLCIRIRTHGQGNRLSRIRRALAV